MDRPRWLAPTTARNARWLLQRIKTGDNDLLVDFGQHLPIGACRLRAGLLSAAHSCDSSWREASQGNLGSGSVWSLLLEEALA